MDAKRLAELRLYGEERKDDGRTSVVMLLEACAEIERLHAAIRQQHENHCAPIYGDYKRHAPDCLLHEIEQ